MCRIHKERELICSQQHRNTTTESPTATLTWYVSKRCLNITDTIQNTTPQMHKVNTKTNKKTIKKSAMTFMHINMSCHSRNKNAGHCHHISLLQSLLSYACSHTDIQVCKDMHTFLKNRHAQGVLVKNMIKWSHEVCL